MVMQIQSLQPSPAQPKVVATGNVPACCYLTNDEQLAQNIEHVFFQAGVEQALRVHIEAVNDPVDALVAHSAEFGAPRILVLDIMVGSAAADEQAILGIQVVQQLTQSPLFGDTLIIAIGTLDSATHYRQLRNAGVHDYLVAPVELDTLSITVMNALSSADLSSQSTPAVSNDAYIDKNFANFLIIWDKIFGTFQDEEEQVRYGLTHNINTYNPLRIATHEFAAIKDEVLSKTRRRPILAVLFGTPESAEPPRG